MPKNKFEKLADYLSGQAEAREKISEKKEKREKKPKVKRRFQQSDRSGYSKSRQERIDARKRKNKFQRLEGDE